MADRDEIFTPGASINKRDFFSGRLNQIRRVVDTIPSPGRHPVIFGQRGVGKTSLANILSELLPDVWTIKINCDSTDNFTSVWDRVLTRASNSFKTEAFGFSQEQLDTHVCLRDYINHDGPVTPAEVADILGLAQYKAVIILDEFDRITDEPTKLQMADLIKNISDTVRGVTLVIVGVGASIFELIGKHPSIERNMVQIEMPSMNDEEIKTIIQKGFAALNLKVDTAVQQEIISLSNGFPHYAHLLGLSIAKANEIRPSKVINLKLFRELACSIAIEDSIETYRNAYLNAVRTSKPSRYPQVLCACGFAACDEQGVFRATDVVDAMNDLFELQVKVQAVVPALGEFCDEDRGPVLNKVNVGDRSHYRFVEPMMRPFLKLRAEALRADRIS